eukprot:3654083-Amphidinium_carterae.1
MHVPRIAMNLAVVPSQAGVLELLIQSHKVPRIDYKKFLCLRGANMKPLHPECHLRQPLIVDHLSTHTDEAEHNLPFMNSFSNFLVACEPGVSTTRLLACYLEQRCSVVGRKQTNEQKAIV